MWETWWNSNWKNEHTSYRAAHSGDAKFTSRPITRSSSLRLPRQLCHWSGYGVLPHYICRCVPHIPPNLHLRISTCGAYHVSNSLRELLHTCAEWISVWIPKHSNCRADGSAHLIVGLSCSLRFVSYISTHFFSSIDGEIALYSNRLSDYVIELALHRVSQLHVYNYCNVLFSSIVIWNQDNSFIQVILICH